LSSHKNYLDCGRIEVTNTPTITQTAEFVVTSFKDVNDIIIPFFTKYPLQSIKKLDFEDFCKCAELMKNKAHLTEQGIKNLRIIKAKMNRSRSNENL